jgi:hypothetical protein
VQALNVAQETAHRIARAPIKPLWLDATAKAWLKYVKVDSEEGTLVIGNREPPSGSDYALQIAGLTAVIGAPTSGLGGAVDDYADDILEAEGGYVRAIPKKWAGTSRGLKTYPGEDGLSVFEDVLPEEVLAELPGKQHGPNTTVIIPKGSLPPGTQVIDTDAPNLSKYLSDAHKIFIRPEGWSVKRFAKCLKKAVGWE